MEAEKNEKQTQDEINSLIKEKIKGFEEEAKKLSEKLNVKVIVETVTVRDDNNVPTGKVLKAFFKQPHIITAVRAMDLLSDKRFYECGFSLWDACIMHDISDAEISDNDKYKIGICPKLSLLLDVVVPDLKKN